MKPFNANSALLRITQIENLPITIDYVYCVSRILASVNSTAVFHSGFRPASAYDLGELNSIPDEGKGAYPKAPPRRRL